jgi:hypothetical protein
LGERVALGVPLGKGCGATLGVLGTLGRYLRYLPLDLLDEVGKHFAVVPVGG